MSDEDEDKDKIWVRRKWSAEARIEDGDLVWRKVEHCDCAKVGYVTKAEARQAARKVGRHTGYKYNTYRCPTSKLWHLASKEAA